MVTSFRASLDPSKLPAHVGIIMDGNGRWARRQHMNRSAGHSEGLKTTKAIVRAAAEVGLKYLSLYTFSTENWKRAEEEVSFLMGLVRQHLRKEFDFYKENRIQLRYSGDISGLPVDIQNDIRAALEDTKDFEGLTLNIALNYGGRNEIVRSIRKWMASQEARSIRGDSFSEENIRSCLDNPDIPDPDLIIRTAGEIRTSNFLLWESAYAELYFTDKLWPDWKAEDFYAALGDYQKRVRKYGGTV